MKPINNIEASTLSKSRSSQSVSKEEAKNLAEGKSSLIDAIFPLIDELYKKTAIPKIFYYIGVIFYSLQLVALSMCPGLPQFHHFDLIGGSFAKKFLGICMFTDMTFSDQNITMGFVVTLILALVFIFVLTIEAVIHHKYLIFFTWTLYITRFIFEFIPLLTLCPIGNLLGMILTRILEKREVKMIVMGIVTVILYIIFLSAHYMTAHFGAKSVYIPNSIIACWDGFIYFLPVAFFSLFCFISYILRYFEEYMLYFLIGFKILCEIVILLKMTNFPFITYWMNAFFFAYMAGLTSLDIIYLVQLSNVTVNYLIQFTVLILMIAITYAIGYNVANKHKTRIAKELTFKAVYAYLNSCREENEDNDNEVDEYLENKDPPYDAIAEYLTYLGLDRNPKKALMYLHIGLAERSQIFLNWSLTKFISEKHSLTEVKCEIAHIISFFPSESRLLSYYISEINGIPGLNYEQRFMMYELHKVRKIRQSSASNEATKKLLELRRMQQICYSKVTRFFSGTKMTIDELYDIRETTVRYESIFNEAMTNWPNNIKLCEDYSTFLIECATDFIEGIKMTYRGQLIELGKNFIIDTCFKSMIRCYPAYLKSGILDVKGNFIIKKMTGEQGSQTSLRQGSSNSAISTGTIDGQLDLEIEDRIAKTTFKFHQLRLALQKALANRKSKYSKIIKIIHSFALVLMIAISLFLYFYLYDVFDERSENMLRQLQLNNFRYGYDAAFATMIVRWGCSEGYMTDELHEQMKVEGPTNYHNINLRGNELDEIARWIDISKDNLEGFMIEMVHLAKSGFDVLNIMSPVVHNELDYFSCSEGKPTNGTFKTNLKNAFVYLLLNMNQLLLDNDFSDWATNNLMCQVVGNSPSIIIGCRNLARLIGNDQERQRNEGDKLLNKFIFVFCILYFILVVPALVYSYYMVVKEINQLITIILKSDEQEKEEAALPIKKNSTMEDGTSMSSKDIYKFSLSTFGILVFLVFAIGIADILGVCLYSKSINTLFLELNQWLRHGISRGNYMLESLVGTTLSIMIKNYHLPTTYTTSEDMIEFTKESLKYLIQQNDILLRGDGNFISCIGANSELDRLNLKPDCHEPTGDQFHDSYRCASIDQSITLFVSLTKELINNIDDQRFEANSNFYHLFHIANIHLADKLYMSAEILASLSQNKISEFHTELNVVTWGCISIAVVLFGIFCISIKKIDSAYSGAMQVMRRLPPHAIISNSKLTDFIMRKEDSKKIGNMPISMSVIHLSQNQVVLFSKTRTIDAINNAVTELLGFTNDQLLGQPLSTIIPEKEGEELYNAIDLMENGQSNLIIDKSIMAITDNDTLIPVHATIIGITNGSSSEAKSFAIIMRDETELIKNREAAQKAKEQSENLLYQILPRDIVNRLNAKETDITIVVQSASIIFIDIVKFSDYASSLAPSNIMESLSTIFAAFDAECAKYNLITKIKLIGDVYMAAAGLFNPDEQPSAHASQTVTFGLKAIESLEETNTVLEANLQVRVGVNTGGPVIAGVLGTDKPMFDIIGDPINVASRLQSTCIPGSVQISQSTFEAIQDMQYNIESRGEIELKGKGKQRAYIVRTNRVTLSL